MRNLKKRSSSPSVPPSPSSTPSGGGASSAPPPEAPRIDLGRYSEATRRAIYDAVVATHFSATEEEIEEALRQEEWIETHTAEEAAVRVEQVCGRWLVCWRMLDEPADVPESFQWEVLAVHEAPDRPFGLGFSEV